MNIRLARASLRAALSAMLLLLVCPAHAEPRDSQRIEQFEKELQALAASLKLPGVAYVVVRDGTPVAGRAFGTVQGGTAPFTTGTPLRIASVTKGLSATIAMQLVEEGKLDLAAPAARYLNNDSLPPTVQVQHLLTHTSEGIPGGEYVYGTNRFGKLGAVLSAADGRSFERLVRARVIERAGMRWYHSEHLAAHGGLVATVDEMAKYIAALDDERLLGPASLERLARPSELNPGRRLPVSLGWFAQTVQDERLMWSFGQDDEDHSGALLLRLPDRKLTLFILANANMISDPFRLLMGDVSKSPFAMSFLRLFVFSPPDRNLPPLPAAAPDLASWLDAQETGGSYSYRDELLASAMLDSWLRRTEAFGSKLALAGTRYGLEADPVLHFGAMQLGWDDPAGSAADWGRRLLQTHPDNRWILLSQGYLLQRKGAKAEAAALFERILALPNQERDYLALLFRGWSWSALADIARDEDPEKARNYLRLILESGVGNPIEDNARKALAALGG